MAAVAYLVVANPSAKNNLGTLIRCAAAFSVEEVVVIGSSKWSTHGAHGSNKHVRYRCFEDWESAATFLRTERGCDLCGIVAQSRDASTTSAPRLSGSVASAVEAASPHAAAAAEASTESVHREGGEVRDSTGAADSRGSASADREHGKLSAVEQRAHGASAERLEERPSSSAPSSSTEHPPDSSRSSSSRQSDRRRENTDRATAATSVAVRRRPFRRNTAFLVGHRNRLGEEALRVCDFLVHIEQATSEFSVELGAPVTTSIALHHFTAWARYEEREFTGEKFSVDREAARCRSPSQKDNPLAGERMRLREELRASDPLDNNGGNGDNDCGVGLGWLEGGACGGAGQGDY